MKTKLVCPCGKTLEVVVQSKWPGYFEGPPAPPKGVRELKAEPEKIKKALKEELRRRTVRIKSILP